MFKKTMSRTVHDLENIQKQAINGDKQSIAGILYQSDNKDSPIGLSKKDIKKLIVP